MDKKFWLAAAAGFFAAVALFLALELEPVWPGLGLAARAWHVTITVGSAFAVLQFILKYRRA